jgi:hypothetical protein
MKRLIILMALFAVCRNVFSQAPLTKQEAQYNFFEFSLGADVPFINNQAFNNWTETNYHNRQHDALAGNIDLYFIGKNYDFGVQGNTGNELYQTITLYLGHRITPLNSPISSYLNIGFGGFQDDVYNYAPVGYLRQPDEIGQRLYMQYTLAFLSLQLRSYINSLSFNISRNRRVNFRSGFYVNFNYRPLGANWQYGYDKTTQETEYDDDGDSYTQTNTNYTSHFAPGVPALASTFWDAGAFVSVTLSTARRHKFYSN